MSLYGARSSALLLRRLQQRLALDANLKVLCVGSCALPASLAPASTERGLQTCTGTSNHEEAFNRRFNLPVNSSISIRLHRPGNVEVAKGAMEEVTFEVTDIHGPKNWQILANANEEGRDVAGRPDIELREDSSDFFESGSDGEPVTRSVRAWVPERFCSVEVTTEGGAVAVAHIKEGALTVSTGQSQFPLTFQMPESGLALPNRRWHASRKGGDVSLGSIAASTLDVSTHGGSLRGSSVTADEVDIDTCAGDITLGRLMGNSVAVSSEDTARGTSGVGRIQVEAVYAAALHMQSGGADVHVSELNSQDAFMGVLGRGSLTVRSLAGSCVLAAGAPGLGGGPMSVQVSGEVGTVVATTQGQPITCTLPVQGKEGAVCVVSRPHGAPSLQHIFLTQPSAAEAMRGLELWEHCTGAQPQGGEAWQVLGQGGELHSYIQGRLSAFTKLKCCEQLLAGDAGVVRWSRHDSVPDQAPKWSGLVLLDAGGGPVKVQWQTWQDMIRSKMQET